MPEPDSNKPSFSSGRRWVFRLNFLLGTMAFFALLVMTNYLAGGYYRRFQVDAREATQLSRQTLQVLDLLTNKVEITIFFDPEAQPELYNLTSDLLTEYKNANPNCISIKKLNYNRSDGEAKLLLGRLNLMGLKDKDFVLFESNGRSKICYANHLADWDVKKALAGKPLQRSGFRGEQLFTSAINSLMYPQTLKAYFLSGHGEHDPNESVGGDGYSKMAAILKDELNTDWQVLSLHGTNTVPSDCGLLVVGGPRLARFVPMELERVENYLKQGGRMLLLFDNQVTNSGMETILSKWGADAMDDRVIEKDAGFKLLGDETAFFAAQVSHHPIMDAILAEGNMSVTMISPRPFQVKEKANKPGEPNLSILAQSSPKSILSRQPASPGANNLIVAIDQGSIKGTRGGTRIVAVGDSGFVSDQSIDWAANHTFVSMACNWLMERPEVLLAGIVTRPIKEYKLIVTDSQLQSIELLFLAGLPGFAFLIGGMVWLRRRR